MVQCRRNRARQRIALEQNILYGVWNNIRRFESHIQVWYSYRYQISQRVTELSLSKAIDVWSPFAQCFFIIGSSFFLCSFISLAKWLLRPKCIPLSSFPLLLISSLLKYVNVAIIGLGFPPNLCTSRGGHGGTYCIRCSIFHVNVTPHSRVGVYHQV